ncbi:MAG: hypothetical protein DHS20C18_14300 [Saprospiraceae bacterium]|nr:MAG: hypothetical protein DHS20C18_14300 [Saprospiraceae bacterium]
MRRNLLPSYGRVDIDRLFPPRHLLLVLCSFFLFTQFASAQFSVSFDVTEPSCFGLPTGSVTANTSGGTAPFSYVWSTGSTGATLSGVLAGSYSVTVTDDTDFSVSESVNIDQPDLVTVTFDPDVCQLPFSVTAQGGGGIPPYHYNWEGGVTTATLSNLSPGTYCLTVTDQHYCGVATCVTLEGTPLEISLSVDNLTCPDSDDGSITATPTGGTAPYTYIWSNGGTDQSINNLEPGTYSVTVTDDTGCTVSGSGTVSNVPPIVITPNSSSPTCPNDNNGSVSVSVSGGTGPYTYLWNTGATGAVLPNLTAGTYTVTVTDANGCPAEASIPLQNVSNLMMGAVGTPETCPDENDGYLTANPSNGVPVYTYIWSNGATTQVVTNVAPGTYSVTVTDAVGCTRTATAVVQSAPDFEVMVTGTNVTTCGGSNGTATATVTDGTPPYTYLWDNGESTQTISGLSGGEYNVTVTNSDGCIATGFIVITVPPEVSVQITATDLVCAGESDGVAAAVVSGGTAPFGFVWSTGETTASIADLAAGTYSVTVMDVNGCMDEASATINEAPGLSVSVVGTDVVCGEGGTGSATALVDGGTAPFAYLWTNGATTATVNGLATGTYGVTVTDANDCTATGEFSVLVVEDLDIEVISQDLFCFEDNTGRATATASGGTSPYTYEWSDGTTDVTINGVAAGTYSVTATDANGCTVSQTIQIDQPALLEVEITTDAPMICPESLDGSATANPSGGTTPYTYLWSNGATTQSINDVAAGTYTVTVTDSNDCEASATITITEAPELIAETTGSEIVCGSENEGNAEVTVTGGTPPFTFMWSNGSEQESIENLGEGTYTVTVTDALGCTATAEFTVDVIDDFLLSIVPRDVLCFGDNTGSILVNSSGGTAPYTYLWSNGATTNEIVNLETGTYNVTVTEANGCQLVQSISIDEPTELTVTAIGTDAACFDETSGSATATANGGATPYTYAWSDGQTTATANNLSAGTYMVTLTDANFCTDVATIVIEEPAELSLTVSSPIINCGGTASGEATAIVIGGNEPYTYLWSNGATTQTITGITAGIYGLTVTDAAGCDVSSQTISIQELPELTVTFEVTNIVCSDENIGAISTTISGGTSPYTYAWSNGATTANLSNLSAGTYDLTVTDANQCSTTGTATVTQMPNLEITLTSTDITCNGADDGTATVMASGGEMPYTYDWSTGGDTPTITGLAPGTYTVTVTGNAGCSAEGSVTIIEPTALMLNTSSLDVDCTGNADGQVTVTASGGTSPYTYLWDNGATTATIGGLIAGTYSVTVTDVNGCTATASETVNEPTALGIDISGLTSTCTGSNDGAATATGNGGTPPYTYSWSNGANTASISNVPAGIYTVTVTDANQCSTTATANVPNFNQPTCSVEIVQPVHICVDGELEVVVSGGTGPYTYLWSNGATTASISDLGVGDYSVVVTDANGCTTTCQQTLGSLSLVGDYVWLDEDQDGIQDASEMGIGGVTVIITNVDEDDPVCADTTVTDSNGNYYFEVPPGTYKITFVQPIGLEPSPQNAGGNDAVDSDADPIMGMTEIFTIGPNETDLTFDAGFYSLCVNLTDPGIIGYNQYLCGPGGDPDPIQNIAFPSGGSGPIEYIWMYSVSSGPFNQTTYQAIPNSNSPTYDPGPLFQTTYFVRCARREGCSTYIEPAPVEIVVGMEVVPVITGPSGACRYDDVTFTANGIGPDAVITWHFGSGAIPNTAVGSPVTVSFTSTGNRNILLEVTEDDCTAFDRATIHITNSPVECGTGLVIDAEVEDQAAKRIRVNWSLEENNGNIVYQVERSSDGENFQQVGAITEPTSVQNGIQYFEYFDIAAKKGRSYYRVKAVENNGNSLLSDVVDAVIYGDSELSMVYPNPANDMITIEFFDTFGEEVTLEVISVSGKRLTTLHLPADVERQQIDLSAFPTGAYFIRMKYGKSDVKTVRVLKY